MRGDLLQLRSGEWELDVESVRGGAVTALRHRGRDVLVSTNPATTDAMGSANFVLVPYANRIAGGRFTHAGRDHVLPQNFGDHAHPLHGTGWKRAWSVVGEQRRQAEQVASSLMMRLRHTADAHWPWSFDAEQRLSIAGNAVRFELIVTNQANEAAPVGVGFHPAFAACAATTFRTQLEGVWAIDAESLPVALAPASAVLSELSAVPGAVRALREQLVDHCFTGWSREMRIDRAGHAGDLQLELSASPGLEFLQLYTPPGKHWFCAEPMSQMPDAINRPATPDNGLRLLAPGESLAVWMQIAEQK